MPQRDGESHPRLSRFKRSPNPPTLTLTERDRTILQLVHRHRFLRSDQIGKLLNCASPQVLRRLQLLYHHGYLERPRAQLDYYHHGGSRPIVYGLGNKGGNLLKEDLGDSFRKLSWGEKNRGVGRVFLEHTLLVSEFMVELELSCRNHAEMRLVWGDALEIPRTWRVRIGATLEMGVIPDRVFVLEFTDSQGRSHQILYLLEADRGTMPVTRNSLSQTSLFRKLLAYEATWALDLHKTLFGTNRFRVVFVTKSHMRVKSLVEACSGLDRGHGLFMFSDRASLLDSPDLLSAPWQTGRSGESTTLSG